MLWGRAEVFRGLLLDSTSIPNKGQKQMQLHNADEGEFAAALSRHVNHVSHQCGLQEDQRED
jgi:hypothetical protein